MERLKQIAVAGLQKAFEIHQSLGAEGEELVQKNQFGETALRVDIEAEKAILDFLRQANIPIRVISEEHGTTEIADNPIYLGILDGLDGSNVYKKERGKGRYGTMFGIFDSTAPSYKDYLVSGVMEHSTGRLFIASKNGGALVMHGSDTIPIRSSGRTVFDKQTKIFIDEYFELNRETFSKKLISFQTHYGGCSAVYYVDVASGAADMALECTRKGNLEIAVAYGLEKEAGAVMVDLGGEDIGDKKYFDFGQKEQFPIITASTRELALGLIEYINRQK